MVTSSGPGRPPEEASQADFDGQGKRVAWMVEPSTPRSLSATISSPVVSRSRRVHTSSMRVPASRKPNTVPPASAGAIAASYTFVSVSRSPVAGCPASVGFSQRSWASRTGAGVRESVRAST